MLKVFFGIVILLVIILLAIMILQDQWSLFHHTGGSQIKYPHELPGPPHVQNIRGVDVSGIGHDHDENTALNTALLNADVFSSSIDYTSLSTGSSARNPTFPGIVNARDNVFSN